jgi:hypothetical protein
LIAKNAAPCLTDQISHSHSSCVWVRFRDANVVAKHRNYLNLIIICNPSEPDMPRRTA